MHIGNEKGSDLQNYFVHAHNFEVWMLRKGKTQYCVATILQLIMLQASFMRPGAGQEVKLQTLWLIIRNGTLYATQSPYQMGPRLCTGRVRK